MAEAKFVERSGRQLLLIDIAHADLEGVVEVIRQAKALVNGSGRRDLLTVTDVTGTQVTSAIVKVLKEFVAHNGPYVRAGAVVGLDRLRAVEFVAIVKFSGRNLRAFSDIEAATKWLLAQSGS
ncbi:MAG TPA: hypothetical protein VL221_02575 [Bacteroidota bacterium]|nr:hypothetical protein [Bacteroidota bacterium]